MENANRLIQVDEFNGKYFINESYRPIAKSLVDKFDEIGHVMVNGILFIEDRVSIKKKNGNLIYAQVGQVPEKWDDVIYQITGKHFNHIMEIFRNNISMMSRE